jgi:signal transduction histidine kinase/FixJ family two-component response regulator
MTEPNFIVADDWTRNWQASIAVKITAIVLWVVIIVTFSGLVLIIWNQEKNLNDKNIASIDNISHEISTHIAEGSDLSAIHLVQMFKNELEQRTFDALEVSLDGQKEIIGSIPTHADTLVREINTEKHASNKQLPRIVITAYFTPTRDLIINERRYLLVGAALAILAFGSFLTWVIKNVLSIPFDILVDATKMVSDGNLSMRINSTRDDEFGHLAKFFNQMLDRISEQQSALKDSNADLSREVSIRLDAEQALINHRDQLEKTVAERTADLAIARDQALQASQTKSDFIANISHEVRTPLTAIIGFSESILNGSLDEPHKLDAVKTITRNGRHLLTILNDILDLSKLDADKLTVEMIELSPFQIVSDIESLVGMQARDKGLKFEIHYDFPLPRLIISDPTRLKQILLNLCTNAVKFTDSGTVRVLVSCSAKDQQMTFIIIDSGIGLSQDAQERLFMAFSQADSSTTRRFGGTGLGLYISRKLAQMLGGDIRVESIEGLGSKFILTIDTGPLSEVSFAERLEDITDSVVQLPDRTPIPSLTGKVLLAEDSIDNQRLVSMYLRHAGVNVTVAENGQLAVEYAMADEYDLILMDIQMPVMDGMEAVRILRATGYSGPIIALTANAMKEDQARYLASGFDGFLSKPIDQAYFFTALSTHMAAYTGEPIDAELSESDDPEYKELVALFRGSLPDYLIKFEEAFAGQHWEQARSLAHKLKGNGGGFGHPEITQQSAILETALREERYAEVASIYAPLATILRHICDKERIDSGPAMPIAGEG